MMSKERLKGEMIGELYDQLDADIMVQIMNVQDKVRNVFYSYLDDMEYNKLEMLFEDYIMPIEDFIEEFK